MATFAQTVNAAINDTIEFGYESEERLQYWMDAIRTAALAEMVPEAMLDEQLRRVLTSTYERLVEKGGVLQRHEGIARYTIDRIRPDLRAELDRRIMASANLIKLNREEAINNTLRRFQGWATSIPAGGTDAANKRETRQDVRKALASLPYAERRVLIDQGHKLSSAISDIVAQDQGAIGARWRSHYRQRGYAYREEHKERDGIVYAVRASWAVQNRLIKAGPQEYYEDHEKAGQLIFCRCWIDWVYTLRDMPADMLTEKGKIALAAARVKMPA